MALNLFKRKPTDIRTMRSRKTALAERHSDTQDKIKTTQDTIAALLIEGADGAVVAKAQIELVNAERDAAATADAISRLDAEIARIVAEQTEAEDRKVREATVSELAKHEARINDAAVGLIKALVTFADATDPIVPTVFDAAHTNLLTRRLAAEFPQATALITNMIRHHAGEVLSGRASSKLAAREVAPRPVRKKASEVTGLVAMKHICWSEGGSIRVAAKGWPVALPIVLAEHAMAIRAALPPGDFDAAALANSPRRSRDLPRTVDCIALDQTAEEAKQAAMKQAAADASDATAEAPGSRSSEQSGRLGVFERIDRGPALVGTAKLN